MGRIRWSDHCLCYPGSRNSIGPAALFGVTTIFDFYGPMKFGTGIHKNEAFLDVPKATVQSFHLPRQLCQNHRPNKFLCLCIPRVPSIQDPTLLATLQQSIIVSLPSKTCLVLAQQSQR